MKKGAFLKENRVQQQPGSDRPKRQDRAAVKEERLRKQKCRLRLFGVGSLVVLLILVVAMVVIPSGNPLVGRWDMDEVTSYEFFRNGKGTMVLPSAQYGFAYSIEGNVVYIDFDYDGAKDAQYIFTVDEGVLKLEGGNSTTQGTYVLTSGE